VTETESTEPIPPPAPSILPRTEHSVSGWTASGPRSPSPLVLVSAWLTAAALAATNAYVLAERRSGFEPGSAAWIGYIVAIFLLPFIVAISSRAIVVWVGRRRGDLGRSIARSGWIPLVAIILICGSMSANVLASGRQGSVHPIDAIRISGPFTLRPASADSVQIAAAGFKNDKTIHDFEVREIVGDDGSLSLLVVVDGSLRGATSEVEQLGRGIESSSGLTTAYETIRDRRVAVAVGDTLSVGAWVEDPLDLYVYAVTPTRLHQIIEAILDAPRPGS
jgi:hypothetical protein